MAGYSRFKGKGCYDSLTYPPLGYGIKDGKIHLAKIGDIKIKLQGQLEAGSRLAQFVGCLQANVSCLFVEIEDTPLPPRKDDLWLAWM